MKYVYIDPANGSRYGFPKKVPETYLKSESLLRIWLLDNGYPANELELGLKYFRYWNAE